ncbi:MAG: hypothetical protein U1B30_14570 [Pseudomonadota bacterium]|nr:hypothetical protein [Pseudomonadota bacterium]
MDHHSEQPLTPAALPIHTAPLTTEEAKARLRAAAQNLTLSTWIGKNKWSLLAAAVAGGFVAARLRLPSLLGSVFIGRAVPLLWDILAVNRPRSKTSTDSSLKSK